MALRAQVATEPALPRRRHVRFWFGIGMLAILVCAALLSLPFNSAVYGQDITARLVGPSVGHLFGTDSLGRDVLARTIAGLRISLEISLVSVLIGCGCGLLIGAISGYYGGVLDALLMRVTDAVLAVPVVLLAISVIAVVGGGLVNLIAVIALTQWMLYARTARGETLVIKREPYVIAARSLGAKDSHIIVTHVLPQLLPTTLVLATLGVSEAVLLEAGLSFLGLGIQPPDPSLGSLLAEGQQYIVRAPWLAIFPGVVIFLVVLAINSCGDGFRTVLDRKR